MNMRAVGVMDFAGSYAKGVVQAGFDYVAKREPSAFGGFGVAAIERNFHGVQVEVTEPEMWSIVKADMVFGCPPCSGFSNLSVLNTRRTDDGLVAQRGIDSPDNQWMHKLIGYTARVKPEVAVFESVGSAGVLGQPLMRKLWQTIRDETGLDYHMTDVFMNAALVGGDVIRRRYFFVIHLRPFGVDLPRESPRTLMEVIGDLGPDHGTRNTPGIDKDWGHVTNGSRTDERTRRTIEMFRAEGFDWAEGSRLAVHMDKWTKEMGHEMPEWWLGREGQPLTYAVSDNMYVPFRWRAGRPMGVVAGGFLDRAVHPVAPRNFTYREGARFMGLPDDWSLYPVVQGKNDSWLGKAIPVASGRWVSTWARGSIEGKPGEYAGVVVEPKHRVIDVSTKNRVDAIDKMGGEQPVWWPVETGRTTFVPGSIGFYPTAHSGSLRPNSAPLRPDVSLYNGDTLVAKATITDDHVDSFEVVDVQRAPARVARTATPAVPTAPREPRVPTPRAPIKRIAPEEFSSLLEEVGLSRSEAAAALGISMSRIAEFVGHNKPESWLNASRWDDVQATLRGRASVPA